MARRTLHLLCICLAGIATIGNRSAMASQSHYACRTDKARYAITVDTRHGLVRVREISPPGPLVTLRIIRPSQVDECAKYGFILSGAKFCVLTQGYAFLDWKERNLLLDCDNADTE